MPTGYTASVGEGKVTELKDFVLNCARAFIPTCRDSDAPLSYDTKPSDYYAQSLERTEAELARLEALSGAEWTDEFNKRVEDAKASDERYVADKKAQQDNYEAMLSKVRKWEPPTELHENLKRFMREQLDSSIQFDCGISSYTNPIMYEDVEQFKKRVIREARKSKIRAEESLLEEQHRIEKTNLYVKQLFESVGIVPTQKSDG
jgi:hypothetical protein